jgi:hypothetical protein
MKHEKSGITNTSFYLVVHSLYALNAVVGTQLHKKIALKDRPPFLKN